jgi:hypothetical protein
MRIRMDRFNAVGKQIFVLNLTIQMETSIGNVKGQASELRRAKTRTRDGVGQTSRD